jgi:tetratricopeptide (TPR) repeat protein
MTESAEEQLKAIGDRAEAALGRLEHDNRWAEALAIYQSAGAEADALELARAHPAYAAGQKLRAYLYLREANALRALGRPAEAAPLAEQELTAAMASRDGLTIARAMLSLGTTCLVSGEPERGLKLIADARPMFEHGDDFDHRQGLGWWHIIQADLSQAGLAPTGPEAALEHADQALAILRPLGNWPGVARAHAARAAALERQGKTEDAGVARAAQHMAEAMIKAEG